MQIEGIGLYAVEFAVGSAYFRLSLVEVGLGASFAVELLNLIATDIK